MAIIAMVNSMAQADANYTPPESNETPDPRKATKLIIFFAVILTACGVLLGFVVGLSTGVGQGGRIGELIGQSIGVIIFGLLVVALFQLFKRFRNQRSRWKIYCWSVFIAILGQVGNLVQAVAPVAGS